MLTHPDFLFSEIESQLMHFEFQNIFLWSAKLREHNFRCGLLVLFSVDADF